MSTAIGRPRPAASRKRGAALALALALAAVPATRAALHAPENAAEFPERLSETGLYSDPGTLALADDVLAFEPQYPLWTDGADKRRWIKLPPGTWIDARDPDRFVFPRGTKLWKEFAFERAIETRLLELGADGRWRYATYLWSADGREAVLAPAEGVPGACESAPGVPFDVPSRADCRACHEAGPNTVLGFGALQLSSDRDPLAPHARPLPTGAVDLAELVRRGLVRDLPQALIETPPRIAAATPRARAALGYLGANCGMCHSATGALAGLELDLSWPRAGATEAPAVRTALERPSRFRWPADSDPLRIALDPPERSVLLRRMASRHALSQMPPLGTHRRDDAALELVTGWIREDLEPAGRVTDTSDLLAETPNRSHRP